MEKIEQRPDITLSEMQQTLQVHKEINVSISTIARYLEGRLYMMKKLESIPINRNTIEIKEARRDYAFWLQSQHESGGRFCYVDETGFGCILQEHAAKFTDINRKIYVESRYFTILY